MSYELNEPASRPLDRLPLPAWMSRFVGALLADLKLVDSGSLDVLVYCRDDLAGSTTGDCQVAGSVDGT
jgi:hypothetical protein